MEKFFSYEGFYFKIFNFLANLIILNFLFITTSLSIVLIGPAIISLYKTLNDLYYDKNLSVVKTYFFHMKDSFVRGLILFGLVFIVILGGLLISYLLMNVSNYLRFGVIILISFSVVCLSMFLLVYSILDKNLKETLQDTFYVTLSGISNAIIIFLIPAIILIVLGKINIFLFLATGLGVSGYIQIIYLNKVLLE